MRWSSAKGNNSMPPPSMQVLRSDELATDAGSGATITLLNGSRLTLGESTSITAVGRVTAYQVYQGAGYNSPFVTEAVGIRTFERFQGGIDIPGAGGVPGRFGWTRRRELRCAGYRRRLFELGIPT